MAKNKDKKVTEQVAELEVAFDATVEAVKELAEETKETVALAADVVTEEVKEVAQEVKTVARAVASKTVDMLAQARRWRNR